MNNPVTRSQVQRSNLFFHKWIFCAKFDLDHSYSLRHMDHDHIDRVIALRRSWGRHLVRNHGGSWRATWQKITISDAVVEDLHRLCDLLQNDCIPKQIVCYENCFFIYANDTALFDRVDKSALARLAQINEAQIQGTPGSISLRRSAWQQRSYLRSVKLNPNTAQSLKKFLLVQDSVRLSPSLLLWCQQDRRFIESHYFIDHDCRAVIDMMQFISPGLIRKTQMITTTK